MTLGELVRTGLTTITALVAVSALYWTIKLGQQLNRPLVSAWVETHFAGSTSTTYNLVVMNSGNRPAADIQLTLKAKNLRDYITQDITHPGVQAILRCFSPEAVIPLLLNGDKTSSYFGITSDKSVDNVWKSGSYFPIEIAYKDLEGRRYTSMLHLGVKPSKPFNGSLVSKPLKKESMA